MNLHFASRPSRACRLDTLCAAAALVLVAGPVAAQQSRGPESSTNASSCSAQPGSPMRDAMMPGAASAVATLRAVFAAAERNDVGALDTLYAGDSLTVVEGAGINRGWADYRDHHLAPEMKEMKNFRYRPLEIEARVSGDLAWLLYRYALHAETGGRVIDNVGRGTAILECRGGRWVVRHTQTASRPRRQGDPPMPQ